MDMFLNLKDGKLSLNTYRFVGATATTEEDLFENWEIDDLEVALTAVASQAAIDRFSK